MALNGTRQFKTTAAGVESLTSSGGTISMAGSNKRKNSSPTRFYAVKVGHKPGVYLDWKDCEQNITRYKNACFKSFSTLAEANAYIAGDNPPDNSSNTQVNRFYAVARGRVPGIYTEWDAAGKQIKAWKGGAKYKKFTTFAEAEAFVQQYSNAQTEETPGMTARETDDDEETTLGVIRDESNILNLIKRVKRSNSEDETVNQQPYVDEAGSNRNTAPDGVAQSESGYLCIWTDGSSRGNGKVGATAGIGVYFGDTDSRNVAERLRGEPQTNQRAELSAISRALEIAPRSRDVQIRTDSQYSINCLTLWYKNWERNNWQSALKKPVLNRDLVQEILARIREREASGSKTQFVWIRGHANEQGNIAADRLAVLGAQKPCA